MSDARKDWFARHRGSRAELVVPEEIRPETLREAYDIQQAVRIVSNKGLWKLGGVNLGTQTIFNTRKVYYGHVSDIRFFAANVLHLNSEVAINGEVEVAVRISSGLVDFLEHDQADQLFDLMCAALECPYSAIVDMPGHGLNTLIADNCAAGLAVLGRPIPFSEAHFQRPKKVSYAIDDQSIELDTDEIIGGPVEAALDFLRLARDLGEPLQAGQWISTGGCTPCLEIKPTSKVRVSVQGLPELELVA